MAGQSNAGHETYYVPEKKQLGCKRNDWFSRVGLWCGGSH